MAEHTHLFVMVSSSAAPGVLVHRCACGEPGPIAPVPLRPARKFRRA